MSRSQQLGQNQKSEFEGAQKIKVIQLYQQIQKTFCNLTQTSKIAHWGPKIRPKLKVKIEVSIKNCSAIQVDPKAVLEPHITPNKNVPLGPQKARTTPKLGQNQKSEMKGAQEIKVPQLYMQTKKQCLDLTYTPKRGQLGPQKAKTTQRYVKAMDQRLWKRAATQQ